MSLRLSNISHRFGRVAVVQDATLEVAPGEILSLFGPSGCGKTTLLRLTAGLEKLQKGAVELEGKTLAAPGQEIPPEKREIGFVFQDFVLFPHLSVKQNIAFGCDGPAKKVKTRVAAQLEAMDLGGLAERYPFELSGGQQQRTALARALIREPKALLLDEPFASIDTALRRRVREDLRRILKEQNVSVVMVTHDPEEALVLGDRVALMKEGRIVEAAAPEILFRSPQTPEGATIFPGSQVVAGAIENGILKTAIGDFPAEGLASGSGLAVIREGAIAGEITKTGGLEVVDLRFSGPDWVAYLATPSLSPPIRVRLSEKVKIGQRLSLSFDPCNIFIFLNQ
ncbi:MAG: ABC transporter [Hyphococcus sp.]|nr:MAG: ABC transporter [Marinicaulis sp.]